MGISVGSDSYLNELLSNTKSAEKSSGIEDKLKNLENADDEKMLEACKGFESYFLEKVLEKTRTALTDGEEEENEYKQYFGEMLYKNYAEQITESGDLGIAQMLYESMKRN